MLNQCPGQNRRQAQVENIICNKCGNTVEIFSDEIKAPCFKCKCLVYKQRLPSCVDWCKAARECIGEDKYNQLLSKADSLTPKKEEECFAINVNKH